ncbi:PAS domain-containing protein [Pontibacillus yanchengensis]|uniref:PAS domain-containing protein n=1 Tax=Pontibacillus yanchengensis Y32 TaxID=1385514 RepID=A0A0A2T9R1_9BACI|nr:STAS domain-containing protein [Pontibacillus yanchengensis]KGP71148.1 hypothetical protein N782_21680 [Pontibacillus yanchengensis Y32]
MTYLPGKILNEISIGVLAIDVDYQVISINEMGAQLLQVNREDILGKNVYDLFPDAPSEVRHVERTIETGKEFNIDVMPYKWGKYDLYLSVQTRLLKTDDKVIGAMVEFTDVTQLYNKQLKLINRMEDMAVNVIPLSEGVALLPLQPIIDEVEFRYILDKGIANVSRMRASYLIIDFSTINTVDSYFIERVQQLVKSVSLIGTNVSITGIKPTVARTWIHSVEPSLQVEFHLNLQAALRNISTY